MELENFPESESAKRMMSYITQNGFYDNSYVGKWIFEVMGKEWDSLKDIVDHFPEQGFPQTCSWSLSYFEQKYGLDSKGTFEERKLALMKKVSVVLPFTPQNIRQSIEELSGISMEKIQVLEYPEEFRFEIRTNLTEEKKQIINAKNYISDIKPAHLLMLFIAKVIFMYNIKVKIDSKFEIRTDFKALRHLLLDGSWSIDGSMLLDSNEVLENRLILNSVICSEGELENRIYISSNIPITSSGDIGTSSRVISEIESKKELISRTNTKGEYNVEIEVKTQLRVEKDLWFLDGAELLDGSRLLDAEVQEFVL